MDNFQAYGEFARVYDMFQDNVDYQTWGKWLKQQLAAQGITDGLVLDLGCGTGTMTEILAEAGYDMIGVDNSGEMLAEAMEKRVESGHDILYLLQDMQEFELYGTVRAVVSVCDSLNYITEEEELEHVFALVNNYLDPQGIFLFDMNTPYKHREVLGNQIYLYDTDDVYCVWENQYEEPDNQVTIQLHFFARQEDDTYVRSEECMTERAYPPEQVTAALQQIGWEVLGCYHADTEEPLQEDSQRMVFAVRKTK